MSHPQPLDRYSNLVAFCALSLICLIAYTNSLPNSFHFDDFHGIVYNPTVHNLKYIPTYFTDPSTFTLAMSQDWRPILQITYALNYLIGGLSPALFRLFNLFLHIGTAFLIYVVVAEKAKGSPLFPSPHSSPVKGEEVTSITAGEGCTKIALFAALLFAVHTVNTEAMNYIWARSSVLVAFFYLLAFYCFIRGPLSGRTEGNIVWYLGGLAAYALGLGTKGTGITLPSILVLYEVLFLNPTRQNPLKLFRAEPRRLKKYIPVATILLAYVVLRIILLPWTFTRVITAREITSTSYLLTQFRVWVYYLRLFLWPHPLLVDFYGFGWSHSFLDSKVLLALVVIIAFLGLAWLVRSSEPFISFFLSWYFITLLPESSFIPLTNPVAIFRAYLPYVGLSVVATLLTAKGGMWIWRKMKGEEEAGWQRFWLTYRIALALVLIVLTAATIKQNQIWRNEMTLWSYVLKYDPTNPRAHMYVGLEYLDKDNYKAAEGMFEKAVELNPKDYYAYMLRGYFNSLVNRDERALSDYNQAIKLDPRSPYNFFYRGELYSKRGQYDKALSDYEAALGLKPFYTDAHAGIARVYWLRGEFKKLAEACTKIIEIDPTDQRGYRCLQALQTQKVQ
jgi:Tfp pilus assembly protein PilF